MLFMKIPDVDATLPDHTPMRPLANIFGRQVLTEEAGVA
jgi:hypothetical protein